MQKVLALDFGDKYIGCSYTLSSGIAFTACVPVVRSSSGEDLEKIAGIIKSNKIETVVIGMPYHMNGAFGTRCEKTVNFAENLRIKIPGIPIEFQDERLSTSEADGFIAGYCSKNKKKMKNYSDSIAAEIILKSWLKKKSAG